MSRARIPLSAAVVGAVGTFLFGAWTPAHATCESPHRFASFFVSTPAGGGSLGTGISPDFDGVFWRLGFGDPALGAGIDNGSFPAEYGGYPPASWLHHEGTGLGYSEFAYLEGDWKEPRVDGCIDSEPGVPCMGILLGDQASGRGLFALLTARESPTTWLSFSFGDPVLLDIPPPALLGTTGSSGALSLSLDLPDLPAGAIQLQAPECSSGVIRGYRLYSQVVTPGAPAPVDRKRDDGSPATGWMPAHGSAEPLPIPIGSDASVAVTDCVDQGKYYLASSIVVDGAFETSYLSANSAAVPCGTCAPLDGDGDGFRGDHCAARQDFDCDDGSTAIFPGAPQQCDGLNNDCRHLSWPHLTGTSEDDIDGDGPSECEGDPCPRDPVDDADADGFCADADNCPAIPNPGQSDPDGDGLGDPCDPCPLAAENEIDADGLCGDVDNCPLIHNPGQEDADGDGLGDICDACRFDPENDADGDKRCANADSCPHDPDNDSDRDGLCGDVDPCPLDASNDEDQDDLCADLDKCPQDFDPSQPDADGDGIGDLCDAFGNLRNVAPFVRDAYPVAAGDLDGDGDLDVAVAGGIGTPAEPGRVEWYENLSGDGTAWLQNVIAAAESGPRALATGDVDLDGDADIIVGSSSGLYWFDNPGPGGAAWPRSAIESGAIILDMHAKDVDGDGDTDIIAGLSIPFAPNLLVWEENRNGNGSMWVRRTLAAWNSIGDVSGGDMDGDGDLDIIAGGSPVSGSNEQRLAWYENTGGGSFTWIQHIVASRDVELISSVSPADVDRDGDLDLFASGRLQGVFQQGGKAAWHENPGSTGAPWAEHVIHDANRHYPSIVAADVDGDGDQDAVTDLSDVLSPAPMGWHENVASDGSEWKLRQIVVTRRNPSQLAVPDLDADGDPDVLVSMRGDVVEWYENTGLPNRSPRAIAGPDVTVECQGPSGAVVTLDASASSDPEGEPLSFTWTGPFPTITTTDPVAAVTLPRGAHIVRLEVEDPAGGISRDAVEIAVDLLPTTPRAVNMNPGFLWPPDHRLVEVEATGPALCAAVLRGIWSSEPDDGTSSDDMPEDLRFPGSSEPGGDDFRFMLRAERSAGGTGRVYTILYELPGTNGSPMNVTAEVLVPHDRRRLRQSQNGFLPSRDRRRTPIEP